MLKLMASSRQRLAVMGIDLWAVRHASTATVQSALWRDTTPLNSTDPVIDLTQHSLADVTELVKIPTTTAVIQLKPQPERMAQVELIETADIFHTSAALNPSISLRQQDHSHPVPLQSHAIASIRGSNDAPSFHLEGCVLNQVLLLIDAHDLTASQRQLWQNLQKGLNADFVMLTWPSVFRDWQETRGQAAYIAGFLAAYATQKTVLLLGECPLQTMLPNTQVMPSLDQMCESPLLKKQLWLKIRECNNLAVPIQ